MTRASLPRAARLTRAADLRRCLIQGRRRRTEHLDMIWMENTTGHARIGLIVAKHQSSAVARNRLRRRLREIWRRDLRAAGPALPAWDVIVRARREAYQATFAELRGELTAWRNQVVRPR